MVCAHCKMDIPEGASVCGHCRKSTGERGTKAGVVCLALFGFLLVMGWIGTLNSSSIPGGGSTPGLTTPAPKPPSPSECLVVSGVSASTNEYSTTVRGTVTNTCGRDFRYVEINYKMSDKDGAILGRAMDNLTGLADGERWKFEAAVMEAGARYSFESIEGH